MNDNAVSNYLEQWQTLDAEETADKFRAKLASVCQISNGNLHKSKFRSVYWRFYLGGLSTKRECWVEECGIYR